jgi:hypothetical protein
MEEQEAAAFASVLHAAARTGFAGFFAMVLQVTLLMWIRTCMNYQYIHGGSLATAFKVLYDQGGIRRFYSGYSIAVFQAPLGRFFDTAANSGVLALFLLYPAFDNVPTFIKTMAASATAATFKVKHCHPSRSLCMIIDFLIDADATHSLGCFEDNDASGRQCGDTHTSFKIEGAWRSGSMGWSDRRRAVDDFCSLSMVPFFQLFKCDHPGSN